MPNQLTADLAIVGDLKTIAGGQIQKIVIGTIARTNTSPVLLGTLPAHATVLGLRLVGTAASNAGTTAVINVGLQTGTGKELLNGQSVLAAGLGLGQSVPVGALLGLLTTAPTPIVGTYAETGTASTVGGPWQVQLEYVTV